MKDETHLRFICNPDDLPEKFPTHTHDPLFWESLGRAVATFGFLEDVLARATFAFGATTPYDDNDIERAYIEWLPKLERILIDPLGNLINAYEKAVQENLKATTENFNELLANLREAKKIRDVLCHGSWGMPDSVGASLPHFVNRKKEVFSTRIDASFIDQVQKHSIDLACAVMSTVTQMGWQFPGTNGPGKVIWPQA